VILSATLDHHDESPHLISHLRLREAGGGAGSPGGQGGQGASAVRQAVPPPQQGSTRPPASPLDILILVSDSESGGDGKTSSSSSSNGTSNGDGTTSSTSSSSRSSISNATSGCHSLGPLNATSAPGNNSSGLTAGTGLYCSRPVPTMPTVVVVNGTLMGAETAKTAGSAPPATLNKTLSVKPGPLQEHMATTSKTAGVTTTTTSPVPKPMALRALPPDCSSQSYRGMLCHMFTVLTGQSCTSATDSTTDSTSSKDSNSRGSPVSTSSKASSSSSSRQRSDTVQPVVGSRGGTAAWGDGLGSGYEGDYGPAVYG
jgi:hypothetical protein